MELKLWSPLFDLEREWRIAFPRFFGESGMEFRPSIDIVKREGELVITAELAGVDPEDVEVTLDDNFLLLKGEKSEETEISEDDRYIHERAYGKFQRRIPMPEGVSADKIEATTTNGVLTLHVTLPEEVVAEPRKILIESK